MCAMWKATPSAGGPTRRALLAVGIAGGVAALFPTLAEPALGRTTMTGLAFTGPIPTSAGSVPWGSAMDGGAREAVVRHYGYREEEYFLSGTANVYGPATRARARAGQSPMDFAEALRPLSTLMRRDVPFTTRVAVLRPADMPRFSGTVHLIPLHNLDATTYVEKNLLRNGDVWMGLEVCGGTRFGVEERPSGGIANLHRFNPARYGTLDIPSGLPSDWPDLQPGRLGEAFKSINFGRRDGDHSIFRQEISRSYAQGPDIMTKLAEALRGNAPGNPLFGHRVRRIYTAGRSGQSTILAPYIDYHHEAALARLGHVPFDGYMIRVGAMPAHRPRKSVLVLVQSEAEAPDITPEMLAKLTDSDDPRFRYYEIPGVGHGLTSRPNISANIGAVVLAGVQGISDIDGHSQYLPYDKVSLPVIWGMWRNIYAWVDDGIPMPRAPRIDRDAKAPGGLARDKFGNATGGIRLPWMDEPDAHYVGVISEKNPLEGGMTLFSEARMTELYGSAEAYRRRLDARLEQMAKGRWIEAQDIPLMRARGVSPALALGYEGFQGDQSVGAGPTL